MRAFPWAIDNKYYHADVTVCVLSQAGQVLDQEFARSIDAVAVVTDAIDV